MGGEMAHLHVLADEIGPRPATTDAEAHAADYIEAVFAARGLDVERQDFNTPRTYSWAYVIYNLLTILAAVGAHFAIVLWPSFVLATLVAILVWSDLDTRWGLSRLMPRGPSQNIVARHMPKVRRGEKAKRIVIVAHYDSVRASLGFSPTLGKNPRLTITLLKASTFLVPVLILASAFPATQAAEPWLWYATLVVAAYLVFPVFINVHRELFMKAVDGANDNASGVATMLGVMEAMIPEPEAGFVPKPVARRRGDGAPEGSEPPAEDLLMDYAPATTPDPAESGLPNDFSWADATATAPPRGQRALEFDTIEFEAVGEHAPAERRTGPAPVYEPLEDEFSSGTSAVDPPEGQQRRTGGSEAGVRGWLGLSDDFDARREGRKIGTWDRFETDEDDGDDGFGFKGGWAGDDPIGDPDFARNEAARIRRRVTESSDHEYEEKEVWFVATGAEEVGPAGILALLKEYGDELRDAVFINIDNVGAGALYWVTAEGMARMYRSDRRLVSLAKRVSRENNLLVRPRVYKGMSTDATALLARGYRAMSVMAFDTSGRLPNWHWYTDTSENVQPELIELATAFVAALVRDA